MVQEPPSDLAPQPWVCFIITKVLNKSWKESGGPPKKDRQKSMPNNFGQIQNKTAFNFSSNYTNGSLFVGLGASKPWS